MVKKVALINMKGGVGKSTLTVNLAHAFASRRKKVLVVDLDPQFNTSQYLLGVSKYQEILTATKKGTIWNVFEQLTRTPYEKARGPLDVDSVIHAVTSYQSGGKIDLVPSQLELAWSLKNPAQKEGLLSSFTSKVQDKYDLVLIDCAPTESLLTTAAYLSSDFVLVPVKPDYLSSIGLSLLMRSIKEFEAQFDARKVQLAGVVFNATSDYAPEEFVSTKDVKDIAAKHGWYVFENEVSYSRSYPKGAREGKPIFSTTYARTGTAREFRRFADEFGRRIGV